MWNYLKYLINSILKSFVINSVYVTLKSVRSGERAVNVCWTANKIIVFVMLREQNVTQTYVKIVSKKMMKALLSKELH